MNEKVKMNCGLDNDLLKEKLLLLLLYKNADDEGHREHSGEAVQNQGSGCDKYSVKERNWWNIIA